MPEPYVLKGTSTVLREEGGSDTPDLPDRQSYRKSDKITSSHMSAYNT